MALIVSRVTALPVPLVANTVYLVAESATELKIVAVGATPADVRTTVVNSDVDSKITAAIGALDLSNSAGFAADIAARDALVLTKSSFVFVADASADPTVDAGAALYFYNQPAATYTKVAEYESLDVVIPNKAILEDLSDVGGKLMYKGIAIGTVQAGANEW